MKIIVSLLIFISTITAQTTLCYKKNATSSKVNKTAKLQGQLCQDIYSLNDMKKFGWILKESKVVNKGLKYDHVYVLQNNNEIKIELTPANINFHNQNIKIYDVQNNSAKVGLGNLTVGQSGAIIHNYKDQENIIIATATVTNSNKSFSTIKLLNKTTLKQDAIPTTKLKPSNGDTFVLNHLYKSSLLIVPNSEAKRYVKLKYNTQNFLNEDFFASHLKLNETPLPSKADIKYFCQKNQIGTIFMVINQTLYIVDATSFKVLNQEETTVQSSESKLPFFTKIEKIEAGFFASTMNMIDIDFDFNFFDDEDEKEEERSYPKTFSDKNYESYYSNMIGVK